MKYEDFVWVLCGPSAPSSGPLLVLQLHDQQYLWYSIIQFCLCMQASTTELLPPLPAGRSRRRSLARGPEGTIPEGFTGKSEP